MTFKLKAKAKIDTFMIISTCYKVQLSSLLLFHMTTRNYNTLSGLMWLFGIVEEANFKCQEPYRGSTEGQAA